MFHANTERMIEHWRALKGEAAAPARSALDPAAFAKLLPQVFIIGRARIGCYVVRLAGKLVDELHGGGVVGSDAVGLWAEPYEASLGLALEAICRRPEPLVITADGRSAAGQALVLEIMLAPLVGAGGEIDRLLGFYQPITPAAALQGRPIATLGMRSIATAGPSEALPRLRLASVDGRQIA